MSPTITGDQGFVGQHLKNQVRPGNFIYNLASISGVEYSINHPRKVITNNIDCMLDALEQARHTGATFIHLSTVEAIRPSNPYAASKAAQEAIALAYFNTYGVRTIIARSHNIVGQGQGNDKFVPKLIRQIKAGETVEIYGWGSRIYNPIQNIIDGLQQLARFGSPGKVYLIGGGERLTNLEMAHLIARKLNLPLKYKIVNGRAGYKRALRGSGLPIPSWEPSITLDEGLSWI